MNKSVYFSVTPQEFQSLIIEAVNCALSEKKKDNSKSENQDIYRLTRRELSEKYKLSFGTIHNLMKSGKLPYEKIGRKTLFRVSDVENYFSDQRNNKLNT